MTTHFRSSNSLYTFVLFNIERICIVFNGGQCMNILLKINTSHRYPVTNSTVLFVPYFKIDTSYL